MRELLQKNKAVIRFLVIFIGTYLVLAGLYKAYLFYGASDTYYPDPITHLVAKQSAAMVDAFGYQGDIKPNATDPSMNLYVDGHYLARVVEGCNAVSVLILFSSFILAFHRGWHETLLFILAGAAFIYVMNILRIALLVILILKYPEKQEFLHGTLFPAVIYGTVFLLWIGWVKYATKSTAR